MKRESIHIDKGSFPSFQHDLRLRAKTENRCSLVLESVGSGAPVSRSAGNEGRQLEVLREGAVRRPAASSIWSRLRQAPRGRPAFVLRALAKPRPTIDFSSIQRSAPTNLSWIGRYEGYIKALCDVTWGGLPTGRKYLYRTDGPHWRLIGRHLSVLP